MDYLFPHAAELGKTVDTTEETLYYRYNLVE
jgi:hypothetical protein